MSASETVHAPGVVLEDPVAEHALEQPFGAAPIVAALHADERQHPATDAGHVTVHPP